MEPRDVVERMGVDTSKFPPAAKFIPTVYRANYRDPSVFFAVQRFPMRNKAPSSSPTPTRSRS